MLILQSCCGVIWARPASEAEARRIVQNWLAVDARPLSAALGNRIDSVETFSGDLGQAAYHIVHLKPNGFVVVSGDDGIEPVIAFSAGDLLDNTPANPLVNLLRRDMTGRIRSLGEQMSQRPESGAVQPDPRRKWGRLRKLEEGGQATAELSGMGEVSDVRVAPLLSSTWGQSTVCNNDCYNYFTPSNYRAGCVAITMAQLMRYHQYPTSGIGRREFLIHVDGEPRAAFTRGGDGLGGAYQWSLMELKPNCGTDELARQAIGALCFDAGVSVGMKYDSVESTSDTLAVGDVLEGAFGYGNAIKGYNNGANIGDGLIAMVNPNLDAKQPVILGMNGNGGHAAVCDGYGFSLGTMYHHLNMGWGGSDNAWYALPNVDSSHPYSSIYKCIYNIRVTPNGDGETVSGRVLDQQGRPIPNPLVYALKDDSDFWTTAKSDENGIYAFDDLESRSTYTIIPLIQGYIFNSRTIKTGRSVDSVSFSGNLWGINFTAELLNISSMQPPAGPIGSYIRLNGSNFGDSAGEVVFAGGRQAQVLSWSDTTIYCRVPLDAVSGDIFVKTSNMNYSSRKYFTVTDPAYLVVDKSRATENVQDGSFGNPFSTVQRAIDSAGEGDIIQVARGIYQENIRFKGVSMTVRSMLAANPENIAATIIRGSGSGSAVVFDSGEDPNCVLAGLTITGGSAVNGAGIRISGSSPTIRACYIQGNSASGSGGGIYTMGGQPHIESCRFGSNTAARGGAIAVSAGEAIIDQSEFAGNRATITGGAIDGHTGRLQLNGCTFVDNEAALGGATASYSGKAIYNRCSFTSNSATGDGGAVYSTYCRMFLISSSFEGNTAGGSGGAVTNHKCSPRILNCLFSANIATSGGAVFNTNASSAVLVNCTVSGNEAVTCGGVFSDSGYTTVYNTILWANQDASGRTHNAQIQGGVPLLSHCSVENWSGSTGGSNTDADPALLSLPTDGGDGWGVGDNDSFGNLRLAAGSPCIDTGHNTIMTSIIANESEFDLSVALWELDGRPRRLDTPNIPDAPGWTPPVVDIGAYEFGVAVGHWRFDNVVSMVAVDSASNNTALLYGNPKWYPGGGRFSGALAFDGVDDFATVVYEKPFDLTGGITVSAWVSRSSTGGSWRTILSKGDSAWGLAVYGPDHRVHFGVDGPSGPGAVHSSRTLEAGIWHHICATYDGHQLRMFIDGIEEPTGPVEYTGLMATNDRPVMIGANPEQSGRLWMGMLDDVRVYNYALNQREIRQLLCEYPSPADINGDCTVNMVDFAMMSTLWLTSPGQISIADIAPDGGDGRVDSMDLARFSESWLQGE